MTTKSHYSQTSTSLDRIKRSYFIHEGKAYRVESAHVDAFKAAIHAHLDTKQLGHLGILQEATDVLDGLDDLYSRWWLLCYAAKSLRLYFSREQAERAMGTVETTARTR